MNTHRHAADEPLVIENENLLELAPGQDKGTRHILFDKNCEELAFPKIFFRRKFGYIFPREHHLTPTRYFNQCLSNFSQTFASNSDSIFFAQSVLQQKNLKSIYFRKQVDSYLGNGFVFQVPLSCNRAIFNIITKRSPDSSSQSPSTNMYRSQKSSSSQAKYFW